ncbi:MULTISPECIES: toll/interleukin-1 receptor domain-containing protein [unclassified Streptomyces]|uniref:toll/interleukin-1 receptor domain-containing protein n=1 Tax=unclassified Streptomyces TaxID=2593676 RepID=UPI00278C7D0E|nr:MULTISPECIES: toll/interleukin-1 receptor domain-containing protein [unclassified Streptomyces]
MPDVFINYRTGDGEQFSATLESALSARFGADRVFRASKDIPPGAPFDQSLIHGVRRSGALLALIGPGWAQHPGLRRPEDWVRKEILEAFANGIRVIPILVGRRTERPSRDQLPDPLAHLADCQTLRYDHQSNAHDLKRIGDALATLVPELAASDKDRVKRRPDPGSTTNTSTGDNRGFLVQSDTVAGDINNNSPHHNGIHIGPSHRTVNQSGDGASYAEGDNTNHHTFGRKDDERR